MDGPHPAAMTEKNRDEGGRRGERKAEETAGSRAEQGNSKARQKDRAAARQQQHRSSRQSNAEQRRGRSEPQT